MSSKAPAPLMRSLRVVLSNGASIFVPTSLRTDQPHFLAFVSV